MHAVKCNYCGRDSYEVLYNLPDYMLGGDLLTTLVKCRHCGLVYQNPQLSEAELEAHYPPEYASFSASPASNQKSTIREWIERRGLRKRARIVQKIKTSGAILDIGCASGAFLLSLTPGWELQGVEPNRYAAELGRQAGLDIYNGSLEAARFPSATFDVVTLWDVLEHLPDPVASLVEIRRILKPDGVVIIRTPNFSSWEAGLFGKYWAGLDAPRHFFVFSLDSLVKMVAKSGFARWKRTPSPGLYPAFLLSVQFRLAARGGSAGDRNWLYGWMASPVMRILLAPVFLMLGASPRASWVVLVAWKSSK